ncbi:helix-turn-helix domain-containing protein [Alkaliphilus serpentinus]|uniref:Helix-turn-helix transcriptional regulator n=1 Tax=Alkaliphilus serpentinus TaxID=1482731 RepID=A0A833M8R5_9FIRM|nr:helix-turn-helix transcriptional regulator [Alkaliphilus serpentinus]KAB3527126.1 helix-turn-helix transcriptional regulator [Alkaliphilus serpentinus]
MKINTQLLRGAIYSKFKSQNEFTKTIGWSQNKIGRILKGEMIPNIVDCNAIMKVLSLSKEEYFDIFLPSASPNGDKREGVK